jgi:hypothetical protein
MSADLEAEVVNKNIMCGCCASCGIAEVDDIKLKKCPACDLVRYCSEKCEQEHLPQHEEVCKKREAELRDEIVFRQPEGAHYGDCPICFLPLPMDTDKSVLMECCSKIICKGCLFANMIRQKEERLNVGTCPFCRHPPPKTEEEEDRNKMKRVEANDPVALHQMGCERYEEGDYNTAFEFLTKAAELGDVNAHYQLAFMHHAGIGVEKDEKRELHHLEETAIRGHPEAR